MYANRNFNYLGFHIQLPNRKNEFKANVEVKNLIKKFFYEVENILKQLGNLNFFKLLFLTKSCKLNFTLECQIC